MHDYMMPKPVTFLAFAALWRWWWFKWGRAPTANWLGAYYKSWWPDGHKQQVATHPHQTSQSGTKVKVCDYSEQLV